MIAAAAKEGCPMPNWAGQITAIGTAVSALGLLAVFVAAPPSRPE
jgi:hypothetical protein